ncbi:MAG: APC family permease [Balneolales bacterium]
MQKKLQRVVGLNAAIFIGLGSILGTGIFVSTGLAAGIAGPAVLISIFLAGMLALCNGLNSAQLAASTPVSGGTYEYGYKYLNPTLGFTAGWMFLLAKSASAATAALGFSGYLMNILPFTTRDWLVPIALFSVILLTLVVLSGMKRSYKTNLIIVTITLASLLFLILAGSIHLAKTGTSNFQPFFDGKDEITGILKGIMHATALVFVAFTGYGRIATLGEEVDEPRKTIPKAVLLTLFITMFLYILVTTIGLGTLGHQTMAEESRLTAAPLQLTASQFNIPFGELVVAIGAVTAMAGVMLNLILGLSRVYLAMGRRLDLPSVFARVNASGTSPYISVITTGILIGVLVMVGDVYVTWSFSAFNVLIYYAITNLSALKISDNDRLYPAYLSWIGLISCLFLAFQVEREVWLWGLVLIAAGLIWKRIYAGNHPGKTNPTGR